jgi:predicted MFS family arabinose efflux permease
VTADRRTVVWAGALGLTLLVAIFPQFGLGALGPQLRTDLGLSPADLGLLFTGLYAAGVIGSPIAGVLVDRLGGRRSCIGLLLLAGASLLAASSVTSRDGLILAMVPAGIAMAFANPGTNRWASAADSAKVQAALVGVAQAGVQAGALGAGLLASASALGLDWRGALRIGAMVALVGVVVAWRSPADRGTSRSSPASDGGPVADGPSEAAAPPGGTVAAAPGGGVAAVPGGGVAAAPEGRVAAAPEGRVAAPAGTTATVGSERATQRALAGYALLMGAGTAVVFAYLPSFAVDVGGLSVAAAGATATVFGATALLCRLSLSALSGRLLARVRPLLVAMAVGAAIAIVVLAAGAVATPWIWVGAVLFGATGTTWPAIAFLGVVRASPPGAAGRVTGWVTAAFYLGLWLTPPVAGRVIDAVGYGPAWAAAAACYLAALTPLLALHEHPAAT